MSEYSNCPRCNSEWSKASDKHYTECSNESCRMRYSGNLVMPNFLGEAGKHLGWMTSQNDTHCVYGTLSEVVANKAKVLPWLPFDVTPDQVKILLDN